MISDPLEGLFMKHIKLIIHSKDNQCTEKESVLSQLVSQWGQCLCLRKLNNVTVKVATRIEMISKVLIQHLFKIFSIVCQFLVFTTYLFQIVLIWARVKLNSVAVAGMGLYFGFVLKAGFVI